MLAETVAHIDGQTRPILKYRLWYVRHTITRTPPVEAALMPVTTPSTLAPVPLSVCYWLVWPHPPSPVTGQPVSITSQPATPTTDTPCVTITDTCDFNSSIDFILLTSNQNNYDVFMFHFRCNEWCCVVQGHRRQLQVHFVRSWQSRTLSRDCDRLRFWGFLDSVAFLCMLDCWLCWTILC